MNRRQFGFTLVAFLAIEVALLAGCAQPTSQNAAPQTATQESTAAPAPAVEQEETPAVAQSHSVEAAPAPPSPPVSRREPSRRTRATPAPARVDTAAAPQHPVADVAPPPPQPIVKTLPAGTTLDLIFLDGVSSQTSQAGDPFRARVARDVTHDGLVVIPAGSVVAGSVAEAVPLKKIGGTAKLALTFSAIELTSGSSVDIEATLAEQGKSETKKDAATIGGAAAGGALLGRLVGHGSKGALIGAVVGGAAGTAVAAKTKGEQVEIPVGTERAIQLNRPVDVTVRP